MKLATQGIGVDRFLRPDRVSTGLYMLFAVVLIVGGALIVAYDTLWPSGSKVTLVEGQVAREDVLAPRSIKYESGVLTQAKRDAAVAATRPIYDPPDPSIGTEQSQLARQVLAYLENVIFDTLATEEQKRQDIAAVTQFTPGDDVIEAMLSVDDETTWQAVDSQVLRLLERVMSDEIREDNIQAERDKLSDLISASYSETEVKVIKALVSDLIRVNTFYNDELTRQAQLRASENVPVETRSFARGQMVIREGEIATAAHIEALEQLGLLQITHRRVEHFIAGLLAMFLAVVLLGGYLRRFDAKTMAEPRLILLLALLFLVFLVSARLVDPNREVEMYYFPASALGFLVATLVGPQFAILTMMVFASLVGYMSGDSLEFTVAIVTSSTLGLLSLGRTERPNSYFVAGGVVSLSCIGVVLVFALGDEGSEELVVVLSKVAGALTNGMFSTAVALVGLYGISYLLNIPTSLKITELMQPSHPLLQRLLREAPGTYQHSLQVANLCELGAQQIDANAALVRAAAMYHDVGKVLNPHFFVENQVDGINPHDILDDPYQSARIIIGHVIEGDRLARRHRLPLRVRDFILEHHGTTQAVYFYQKAVQRAEKTGASVEMADFTYPGPRPQSRETAILMLADGCESSVRACRPQSREDVQETVNYIFESRLQGQQLDDSGLTLNDLRVLRDTFVTALQGIFHPRIRYPGSPGQPVEALSSETQGQLPAGIPVESDSTEPPEDSSLAGPAEPGIVFAQAAAETEVSPETTPAGSDDSGFEVALSPESLSAEESDSVAETAAKTDSKG